MLIDDKSFEKELSDAIEYFKKELTTIRSGKASASDLEDIMVEAYGGMNKLNTVGQVLVEDAMNLKVNVWDKGVLPAVEAALRSAETGGSVAVDKDSIRIKFAPMTEEDRKKRVKELNDVTEQYRVRVRQVRQKYMKDLDGLEGVSEDEQERNSKEIQKRVDETINEIEQLSSKKELELTKI
ncbi:ribosome recycling factor [Candidatus Dojkabacteria bacterium]|uniref:Ribosome recycling factor n=1 Tax=Candidatus Dojkabacteria bacterium TaxID=2099670 RepID=A0A955RL01_9BACT|nr:ribosome recycling factor [Candidatus Dojkabacteria bacterium]